MYLVLISLACFSGCVSYPKQLDLPIHSQSLLKKDYYNVDIPSFDGNSIRATIFQPALRPHETAPLVLHVHGFGMFRMTAPTSLYGSLILSGIAAKKAWENGYWVISIDHRGHGGSAVRDIETGVVLPRFDDGGDGLARALDIRVGKHFQCVHVVGLGRRGLFELQYLHHAHAFPVQI